jgi:hypothetical protein
MIRNFIKKLLAPLIREVIKEEFKKSEIINDHLLSLLKSANHSQD